MKNRGTRERASYSERKQLQQQQQQQQGSKRRLSRDRDIGGYDHRSSGRSSHSARSATAVPNTSSSSVPVGSSSSTPRDDADGSSHHYNGFGKHRGGGAYSNNHRPKSGSVGSNSSSRSALASSRERRRAENSCCCCCCCSGGSRSSIRGSEGSCKHHHPHHHHQDTSYINDGGVYLGEDTEKDRQRNECESCHCVSNKSNECGNSSGGVRHHYHHHNNHPHHHRHRRHSNNSESGVNSSCKKTAVAAGGGNCNSNGKSRRRNSGTGKCCPEAEGEGKQRRDGSKKRHCKPAERSNGEEKDVSPHSGEGDEVNKPLLSVDPTSQRSPHAADSPSSDGNTIEGVSLLAAPAVASEQSSMTTASSGDIWQLRPCILSAKETSSASSLLVGKPLLDNGKTNDFVVDNSTSSCASVSSLCGTSTANCSKVDSSNLNCSSFSSSNPNCPNVGSSNLNCLTVGSSNPNCSSIGFNKIKCSSVCSSNPNCSNVSSKKPNCSNVCSSDPNCSIAGARTTNCSSLAPTSGGDGTDCSSTTSEGCAHNTNAPRPGGLSSLRPLDPTTQEPEESCPRLSCTTTGDTDGKSCAGGEQSQRCCSGGTPSSCTNYSSRCYLLVSASLASQDGKSMCGEKHPTSRDSACCCGCVSSKEHCSRDASDCCRSSAKNASPRLCPVESSSVEGVIVNGCGGHAGIETTDNNSLKEHHVDSFSRNYVVSASSSINSSSIEKEVAEYRGLIVSSDLIDDRFCSSSSPQLQSSSTVTTSIVSGISASHLPTPGNSSTTSHSMPSSRVDSSSPSDDISMASLCDCSKPPRKLSSETSCEITSPMEPTAMTDHLVSSSAERGCVNSASSEGVAGQLSICDLSFCRGHHSCQEVSGGNGSTAQQHSSKSTSLPCGGSRLLSLSHCPGIERGGGRSLTSMDAETRAGRDACDPSSRCVQHCHGKVATCCSHQTAACVGGMAGDVHRGGCGNECCKPCWGGRSVVSNIGTNQHRHSSCIGGNQCNPDLPNMVEEKAKGVDMGSHRVSLRGTGSSGSNAPASLRTTRNSSTMVLDYTHALLKDDVPRPRSSFKLDDYHRALLHSLTDDEYQEVFLKHMVLRAGNSAGGSETENASQILDSISQSRLLLQAEAAADQEDYRSRVGSGEERLLLKRDQKVSVAAGEAQTPQEASSSGKSKIKNMGNSGQENKDRRPLFKSKWWKNLKKKKKETVSSVTGIRRLEQTDKPSRSGEAEDETTDGEPAGEGRAEEEDETARMLREEEVATAKATIIWQKQDRLQQTQETDLREDQLDLSKKLTNAQKAPQSHVKRLEKDVALQRDARVIPTALASEAGGEVLQRDAKLALAGSSVLPSDAKVLPIDAETLPTDADALQTDAKILPTNPLPTDTKALPTNAKVPPADADALPTDVQLPQNHLQNTCSDTPLSPEQDYGKQESQNASQTRLLTEQVREQVSTPLNGELLGVIEEAR